MKTLVTMCALACGLYTLCGCAIAAPGIVQGGLFSSYTIGSAGGTGEGKKSGEACAMSILGIVGIGDASIDAAKKEAGITQIAAVDHHAFNILGLYGSVCTVVTGQ
jgi:hypothetical protein